VPLALSTGHEVGLALVAGTFIAFAFLSALVIPRWRPQFPGHRLGWFIVATLVLFVATLAAVEIFAKEPKEARAGEATTKETPGMTIPKGKPPPPTGNPAAGKPIFAAQGCGNCHTFAAAGSSGTIGPNLDEVLKGKDAAFVHESIVDPNKQIAPGYQPNIMPQDFGTKLSAKQLDDLVAFLTQS